MLKLNGHEITPTIFPDKTSQVWRVTEEAFKEGDDKLNIIDWEFEHEAELFHLLQLRALVSSRQVYPEFTLRVPYLPYARQDKLTSNQTTFALHPFLQILKMYFDNIQVLDAHNPSVLGKEIKNHIPSERIQKVIQLTGADIVCFPDKGATQRGYDIGEVPSFHLEKKRNQDTGEIEGLECKLPLKLYDRKILIVDDLCDFGRTFMGASTVIHLMGAKEVHLYTTHGLYTGGTDILFDAGLKRIFNYREEVKDIRGFNL